MSSKEFLEIARDSEDLVPRKLCWAMRWETHYRKERTWTSMMSTFLFAMTTYSIISYFVPGLIQFIVAFGSVFCLMFGLAWTDARRNHDNAKITLERIRKEFDVE